MSALTDAIAKTSGEQNRALTWFLDHTGETVSWTVIKGQTDEGFRLVNQAKGIYKPHYTDYTLSVRQTISSSYADKDVIRRSDGGWAYPYFQEDPKPANSDSIRPGIPI
jgi:putative restriction endonuclease